MRRAISHHWPEYLIEAFALGVFMISAGGFAVLIWAPGSPLAGRLGPPILERLWMGLAMGATAVSLIYSPWGQRSGAHMNPAVTLTFLRLGKIAPWDALFYILAQLTGGVAGLLAARQLIGSSLAAPPVAWVTTLPGAAGQGVAFVAELVMTALLMWVVLVLSNSARWARTTGLAAGALVALFITFEAPLSGMSLNPARTLASALPSGEWSGFWLYVVAPITGMGLAAELYVCRRGLSRVLCAKLHHTERHACIFRCGYCRHGSSEA